MLFKFGYSITKKGKRVGYKCKNRNAKFTPTAKLVKQLDLNKVIKIFNKLKTKELKRLYKLIKETIGPLLDKLVF